MPSLDWIKIAYETLKKANQLDIAEKLMDLREDLLQKREENLELKTESEDLRNKLKLKGKVKFEKGICWIENDEMSAAKLPIPICPQCYQIDQLINRLPIDCYRDGRIFIHCRRCGKSFQIV